MSSSRAALILHRYSGRLVRQADDLRTVTEEDRRLAALIRRHAGRIERIALAIALEER
jgi:hypothetical protein